MWTPNFRHYYYNEIVHVVQQNMFMRIDTNKTPHDSVGRAMHKQEVKVIWQKAPHGGGGAFPG